MKIGRTMTGRQGALWMMVALVLLAFALRLLFIERSALRGDEALSVIYSGKSWPYIIEVTRSVSGHPPLFYLSLHVWEKMTGVTELAARFAALWWGVLTLPLAFALGRSLFGTRTALWSALLLAINPFHIMHSQDVRSYTMLAALSVLSSLLLWQALRRPVWQRWLAYATVSILVVYTHYFGAFLIMAQALFFLWNRARRGGQWLGGILSFLAVGALFLPWLWLARSVVMGGHGPGGRTLSLGLMFQQCLVTFGTGYWDEPSGYVVLSIGLAVLFGLGIWQAVRLDLPAALYAGLLIAVPLVCLFALSRSRPIFRERYLIASAPIYSLFWGAGLMMLSSFGTRRARIWRFGLGISVVLLIAANIFALSRYYVHPRYAKSPEWRAAVSFLQDRLRVGDAVILNHQDQAFLYYYGDENLHVLPSGMEPDPESTYRSLENLAADHDRLWLVPDTARLWDTEGLVRGWLDQQSELVMERSWRGVSLLLYHMPRLYEREAVPVDAQLGETVRLVGFILHDGEGNAVERLDVRPGGEVPLTLYWRAESPVDVDYVVFAHVLDGTGWMRGQQDNQPRHGTFPTRAWVPGDLVVDAYAIPVAADAPPGTALLEIGMYDPVSGERLKVAGADADPEQRRIVVRDRVVIRP